jgi:predicted DNA-binding protein
MKGYDMTIRKNFLFEQEVAKHLEELAKAEGKTQTQIVQEMTEERYKVIRKKKKLEALEKLKNSPSANISNIDIREMRTEKALKHAK